MNCKRLIFKWTQLGSNLDPMLKMLRWSILSGGLTAVGARDPLIMSFLYLRYYSLVKIGIFEILSTFTGIYVFS